MKEGNRVRGLIGVSLAIGAIGEISDNYTGDVLYIPRLASEYALSNECSMKTPSGETVVIEFPEEKRADSRHELHDLAKEIAGRSGFTLKDETEHIRRIKKAETTDEVLDILNEYTSESNLLFTIPRTYTFTDLPNRLDFYDGDLNIDKFKKNVKELIGKLYYVPTEILKQAHVKELKIVRRIYKKNGLEAFFDDKTLNGKYNKHTGIIYLEPDSMTETTFHEIGHSLDDETCGIFGAVNDRVFDQYNPVDFSYGEQDEDNLDVSQSLYGQTSIREDKAEIIENLGLPYLDQDFNQLSPILQKKLILLIARIDQLEPGYLNYWINLSSRVNNRTDS